MKVLNFSGIKQSRTVDAGKTSWNFSTRDDYVRFLIGSGDISDERDLLAKPELVLRVQRHWHGRAQHACRFAQLMAKFPEQHGWASLVIGESDDTEWSDEVWAVVRSGIDKALADAGTYALSIFAPGVLTGRGLVRFIRSFEQQAGWSLAESAPAAYPDMRAVGVRAPLPTSPVVESWAVGFGPFEFLPLTRQAPFTEMAIATKPKREKRRSPRLSADHTVAHLADIPIKILDKTFEAWWLDTQKGKKTILGSTNDSLAKAKVTFAVPATLWSTDL